MARFVLVHGAFHGAWCWDLVTRQLREAGHSVVARDLPGSGADSANAATATLDDYVDSVVADLEGDPEPAVLVAHSMAGLVATQAAAKAPASVAQIVYVAAFLPRDGELLAGLARLPQGAGNLVEAHMVVDGVPPVATMPTEVVRDAFYNTCDEAVATSAAAKIGPQGLQPYMAPVSLGPDFAPVRRYVTTLQDHAVPTPLQRLMVEASPCVETVDIDSDHSPFLSRPAELAALLIRFASHG